MEFINDNIIRWVVNSKPKYNPLITQIKTYNPLINLEYKNILISTDHDQKIIEYVKNLILTKIDSKSISSEISSCVFKIKDFFKIEIEFINDFENLEECEIVVANFRQILQDSFNMNLRKI